MSHGPSYKDFHCSDRLEVSFLPCFTPHPNFLDLYAKAFKTCDEQQICRCSEAGSSLFFSFGEYILRERAPFLFTLSKVHFVHIPPISGSEDA